MAALHDAQSIQYLVQREINELAKQQAGGDMKDGTKIDAQDVMFKKVQLATRAARYNAAFELVAVLFMTAIEVNADILTRPTKLSCWPARLRMRVAMPRRLKS